MDEKNFCFIINAADEQSRKKMELYINALRLPEGYGMKIYYTEGNERQRVRQYNEIMMANDAKYKIYLESSVYIVNENFFRNIIEVFQNKKIGAIGVMGERISMQYPWQSQMKYGAIYINDKGVMKYKIFKNDPQCGEDNCVDLIDRVMMITQYDLLWREDLSFDSHISIVSQCMEFSAKGFLLRIPYQPQPWCFIDESKADGFYVKLYDNGEIYKRYGDVLKKRKMQIFYRWLRKLCMTNINEEEKKIVLDYLNKSSKYNSTKVENDLASEYEINSNKAALPLFGSNEEVMLLEEELLKFRPIVRNKINKSIEVILGQRTRFDVMKKSAELIASCRQYDQIFFWGPGTELKSLFYQYCLQNEIGIGGFIIDGESFDDRSIPLSVFQFEEFPKSKNKNAVIVMDAEQKWEMIGKGLRFYGFENIYFFDKKPNELFGQVSLVEDNGKIELLENRDLTLISNNCTAGFIYHDLELEFLSPTINLNIPNEDYIKFLKNLDYYLELEMEISGHIWNEAEHHEYPIGRLNDIQIQFIHYVSDEQAIAKWEERKKKIRRENLFIIANGDFTLEQMEAFDSLPFQNKKIFSGINAPWLKSCVWIKEFEENYDHNLWFFPRLWYKHFNFIQWFNKRQM